MFRNEECILIELVELNTVVSVMPDSSPFEVANKVNHFEVAVIGGKQFSTKIFLSWRKYFKYFFITEIKNTPII